VVVTNTISQRYDLPSKFVVLDISQFLAEAIRRIHRGGSVSQLFLYKSLKPPSAFPYRKFIPTKTLRILIRKGIWVFPEIHHSPGVYIQICTGEGYGR
jgi:hypothetical protein